MGSSVFSYGFEAFIVESPPLYTSLQFKGQQTQKIYFSNVHQSPTSGTLLSQVQWIVNQKHYLGGKGRKAPLALASMAYQLVRIFRLSLLLIHTQFNWGANMSTLSSLC